MQKTVLPVATIIICAILAAGLPFSISAQIENTLISSQPIKAGGKKGLAPLFFSLSNNPQGSAFVRNSEYPDIFTEAVSGVELELGLYRCQFRYIDDKGRLVYSAPVKVKHPWGEKIPPAPGRIFNLGKEVIGIWIDSGKNVVAARFENDKEEFVKIDELSITGSIKPVAGIEVCPLTNDELEIILLCNDGQEYRPATFSGDTQSYYDGAGSYRGKLPLCGLYHFKINFKLMEQVSAVEKITFKDDLAISASRVVKVGSENEMLDGYIVTNTLGVMKYLPAKDKHAILSEVRHVFKDERTVLYHPTQGAKAIPFAPAGKPQNEFVAGGEGALYHYQFSGKMTKNGEPIFNEPKMILQENADLYSGTLSVPNVVDWDGDGLLDIVSGNSEGRLLFFKNNGSDISPDFAFPEEIKSAGNPILFRPGYNIVQGPLESAWGYLSPTVYDWNNDGLLDVIFSGSRSKHEVMLNRGTKEKPNLEAPVALRIDNMELPGTWRVRPAIAKINGRNAYVILDTEDALHLYWQVDDYTVEDGGKVLMKDGTTITHRSTLIQPLGQRGRAKLQLIDWDDDGVLDLIIGTSKRSSFPHPDRGMPFNRFIKNELGLQVLFMRNVGTNENMKFTEPVQFQVNGKDLYLGTHEYAPFACKLGDISNGLNLIVGVESGKTYFFERKDLTTIGLND